MVQNDATLSKMPYPFTTDTNAKDSDGRSPFESCAAHSWMNATVFSKQDSLFVPKYCTNGCDTFFKEYNYC